MSKDDQNEATADDVLRRIFRMTVERLLATESEALENAPDGVHQHRTYVRRLRSLLAAFRNHLDEAAAHDLRVGFGEWGDQLGVVRDIEVRAAVAESAMTELEIEDDDMQRRLVDTERTDLRRAHARLRELHQGPRSAARMAALRAFAADVPVTDATTLHSLRKVARREARRVRRAVKRSEGSVESLHDVRKAGRRLRYVAEALREASPDDFGEEFDELAAGGEDVHDALGDHRDELIFIARIEIARARAGRAGELVEHYDQLIDRSRERAQDSIEGLDRAVKRVRKAADAI